ncbi:metal ABC transporter substrate-binding protein [Virgibacillus sp. MG-45]|uniref:metal ABC transporter substrate-binding protein n=1 Tax=Virgibacillus sp. MG-45 TaxID=3102791 RepID=UPI002ED9496E
MKKWLLGFIAIGLFVAAGCSNDSKEGTSTEDGKLQVVTTYSIVYDIVSNIAGEHANVKSLVPIGQDPHSYEPLPADVQATTDADLVFYNGLNLETGNSWFQKMIETAGKDGKDAPVFRISEGVTPQYLTSGGHEGEEDPHAWLDVQNGITYAENARDALIQVDPDHKADYEKNAAEYIKKLEELDAKIKKEVAALPEEKRILVTSEGAFKYFSAAYGFHAAYIWEINAHNEGTPEQIKTIVDLIHEKKVPALFVETSVDPRSMETVSNETGVEIAGKIFTDSIGKSGEDGDTYIKMIEWNLDMITDGLGGK